MTSKTTLPHQFTSAAHSFKLQLHSSSRVFFSGFYQVSTKTTGKYVDTRCMQGNGVTTSLSHYDIAVAQRPAKFFKAEEEYEGASQVFLLKEIRKKVDLVKAKLQAIDDGELSISAYDTAWVALVEDIHGSNAPQFPSSLVWIVNHQLSDGSWGDPDFFSAYDRLSCTLACVVALTKWNIYPEQSEKGISFLRQNLHKLRDEDPEHMPSGFEVRFPSLVEMAQNLGLEISQDSSVLQDLYATKELKLKRIPREMLHNVPTTLLYSLEGMPALDWERLLKLQHPNGSFLCSTSSTAYALQQTKDEKCLNYLMEIVKRFKGGVPHSYPVDLFERLWVVDRLERLGVSRHFEAEIKECLDHVHRYWTPDGISWSRGTTELDIDDTSMGFRLLRLHGYDVEANAFQHFEKKGQFFCFVGQMSQGVTEMLSLYRASQVLFPNEGILDKAKRFTSTFLKEKQDLGQVADRWIISKDLVGEVQYALDVPWYASLPRIETRYYIDQYGGDDDVWIGKVLYRMHNVSNNLYLELAKLDYNHCQKLHQQEWIDLQRWYAENNLRGFGLSNDRLLRAYILAMSNIYEPDRATERLAWAQTAALIEVVSYYFQDNSLEEKRIFIHTFASGANHSNNGRPGSKGTRNELQMVLLKSLSNISSKVQNMYKKQVYKDLKLAWNKWLMKWQIQGEKDVVPKDEAELLVFTINLCSGHPFSKDLISQPEFVQLINLTNDICHHLHQTQKLKDGQKEGRVEEESAIDMSIESVEQQMQVLLQHVLKRTDGIESEIKRTFLMVAKSYYYTAICAPATIDHHIAKVLFTRVV